MNTDPCSSVLLTCNPWPAVKDIFTAKTRTARRKAISKTLRSFASSRWIFGVAAGLHCVHLWFRFSIRSHWRGGMHVCHHIPDETCRENLETGHKSWARISSSTPPALVLLWRLFADCFRFPDFLPHPILTHDRSSIEREHLREHVQNLHGAAPRFRGRCLFAKCVCRLPASRRLFGNRYSEILWLHRRFPVRC